MQTLIKRILCSCINNQSRVGEKKTVKDKMELYIMIEQLIRQEDIRVLNVNTSYTAVFRTHEAKPGRTERRNRHIHSHS